SKSLAGFVVSCFKPEPSALTIQMSAVPFEKTIRPVSVEASMGLPTTSPGRGARPTTAGVAAGEVMAAGLGAFPAALPVHAARRATRPAAALGTIRWR